MHTYICLFGYYHHVYAYIIHELIWQIAGNLFIFALVVNNRSPSWFKYAIILWVILLIVFTKTTKYCAVQTGQLAWAHAPIYEILSVESGVGLQ